jgi:hypothetical protein
MRPSVGGMLIAPRPAPAVVAQYEGEGGLPTRFAMQPKWIALGLFVAGITSLLIGASFPYLKHLAIGLISVPA